MGKPSMLTGCNQICASSFAGANLSAPEKEDSGQEEGTITVVQLLLMMLDFLRRHHLE